MKNLSKVLILIVGMNLIFQHQLPLYAQAMGDGYTDYLQDSLLRDSLAKSVVTDTTNHAKVKAEASNDSASPSKYTTAQWIGIVSGSFIGGFALLLIVVSINNKKHPINVVRNFFGYEDWGDG